MPEGVRVALIAFSLTFIAVGGYYRIQSQRSGERLEVANERLTLGIFLARCVSAYFVVNITRST
jgi:hypothetical protein